MHNAKISRAMRRMECFGNTKHIACVLPRARRKLLRRLSAPACERRDVASRAAIVAITVCAPVAIACAPLRYAGDRRYRGAASVKDQIQNDEHDKRHTEHPTDQIRHFHSPCATAEARNRFTNAAPGEGGAKPVPRDAGQSMDW